MSRPNNGARLRPNQFGIYYIAWTEEGRSHRASTRTANLQEAQKILAGFLLEQQTAAERGTRWTVGQVIDYYDTNHVEEKIVDKERTRRALGFVRAELGEDRFMDELASDDFTKYRTARRRLKSSKGLPIKDATIRKEISAFLTAANFCVKNRKLPAGHVPVIELPDHSEPRDRWLTREEAQRLLKAADKAPGLAGRASGRLTPVYRLIAIALSTAKRRRAIETLKWFQVDLKNRMIDFRRPGERETSKRRGRSPISSWLLPVLERAYREKKNEFVLDSPDEINGQFKRVAARAGLKDVTAHTLRHTWGTWAAQGGMSMWGIAGVMSCTVQTATNNYLHHSPEHLRSIADSVSPELVNAVAPDENFARSDARNPLDSAQKS